MVYRSVVKGNAFEIYLKNTFVNCYLYEDVTML